MARRDQVSKQIARRIEVSYFKRLHPFRRNKRTVILVVAAAALAWLLVAALTGGSNFLSPGPVSDPHAFIEVNCRQCHGDSGAVVNEACISCHAGPTHHPNQVFEGTVGGQPICATCHEEHQGRAFNAVSMTDLECTQCHAQLELDSQTSPRVAADPLPPGMSGVLHTRPQGGFASTISSFEADHPEFRIIESGLSDQTPLGLNHEKHLRADLPGPDDTRVQLECSNCHRIAPDGNYFEAINYETDCQSCHPIGFDSRIREEAPHTEPVYVDAFIRTAFSKYAGRNPGEWRENPDWHPAKTMAALESMLEDAPRDLPEWLERQIVAAEEWTFEERCSECHQLQQNEGSLPGVTDPAIPDRWFLHSKFSHQTHRALTCTACHPQVPESSETSDVLLPDRELCLSCHVSSVGAPDTCVTCHSFHDRSQAEPPGRLTPAEILRR